MALDAATRSAFLRALDEDPEFYQAVRQRLLSEELLSLPHRLAVFIEATNRRIEALDTTLNDFIVEQREVNERTADFITEQRQVNRQTADFITEQRQVNRQTADFSPSSARLISKLPTSSPSSARSTSRLPNLSLSNAISTGKHWNTRGAPTAVLTALWTTWASSRAT